jgi:hypothetical protein
MKARKNVEEKLSLREQWARISLEQKLAMFVAPIFVFIVTAVLIPAVRDAIWDAFTTKSSTANPSATDTGRRCGPAEEGPSPATSSAPSLPSGLEVVDLVPCDRRIEISMRNVGAHVSVVKRAEFRVLAMETIDAFCHGAGSLVPISETYDVQLPAYNGVGQMAPVTLRQQ